MQGLPEPSLIFRLKNGNLEPVIENCGGWNCIHEWEPDPTATIADTVKGKTITLRSGVTLIDSDSIKKTFKFSFGLERLGNRKNIQQYIDKSRNFEMSSVNIEHGREHYPGISDLGLKKKVSQIKNNPDKIYYQYNNGPRIVFEKCNTPRN